MATFQFELVSPEKLLLSRQVEMATIPAAEGEMGVLPGHAPMIVALREVQGSDPEPKRDAALARVLAMRAAVEAAQAA